MAFSCFFYDLITAKSLCAYYKRRRTTVLSEHPLSSDIVLLFTGITYCIMILS